MPSQNFNIQKVILAPLDWGLGHATRCIPIIRALQAVGYEVCVAAERAQAHLLEKEFPGITLLRLEGYRVRYSRFKWLLPFRLALQLPRLRRMIKAESDWLDEAIRIHQPVFVISDNRYGFSSSRVPCVFITHQLTVKAPFAWAEKLIQRVLYRYINRFTVCWVPDLEEGNGVAGLLSHPTILPHTPVRYIGLLSRFEKKNLEKRYDYCVLLSGPEPQRSVLEEKMLVLLKEVKGSILLVRGRPGSEETIKTPAHIEVRNHLPGIELGTAIQQSEYIVCRGGYTTLMELLSLGKKAIVVPTPGQTEQEYLAEKLQQQQYCMRIVQEDLSAERIRAAQEFAYSTKKFKCFQDIIPLLEEGWLQQQKH